MNNYQALIGCNLPQLAITAIICFSTLLRQCLANMPFIDDTPMTTCGKMPHVQANVHVISYRNTIRCTLLSPEPLEESHARNNAER